MNILHVTDILKCEGNGVAVAVSNYASQENKKFNVAIYNMNDNLLSDGVRTFNYSNYKKISDLPAPFNNPDLVIFNEVYKPKYLKLYKECIKKGIKYIIIPHGCLVKKSQDEKKVKKMLGNFFLFNRFISKAAAVQFLTEKEKKESHFKYKRSIIIGNGIDMKNVGNNFAKNKSLIYIGRYSYYIKGLDLMIDICSKNKDWFLKNNVTINLYGRNSINGLSELERAINKNDVNDIVKICGPVYGDDKKKVLENAYGFIQLSRHEGQPTGIIEALAYGLPCVVTTGTSFAEYVNDNNCGFGCEFDSDIAFKAIKELYVDEKRRNIMSKNAKKCARKDFDWGVLLEKIEKDYKEIIYDI